MLERTPPAFMNAATALPKSLGLVASSIASAITSPIGCSPAAFCPFGVPRADRMSAVTPADDLVRQRVLESVVYLSTIALVAGILGLGPG